MEDMTRILDLVKAGRLDEATADIQRGLSSKSSSSGAKGGSGPMRDITPKARALPSPKAKPAARGTGKAGKTTRPKSRGRSAAVGPMLQRSGALAYRLHAPAKTDDTAPLIVMLHGCSQSPEDFAVGTGMNAAAATIGAHVVWPEQSRSSNPNVCWSWFEPAHQGRSGEAAAIVSVVAEVLAEIGGDRRVFVAGLSAGGAMAAILGAHYPDVFSGVGVHSGLPVGAARDMGSAFSAMRSGAAGDTPVQTPAIIFHGDADRTVDARNAAPFLTDDAGMKRVSKKIGGRQTTVRRSNADGRAVELWEVDGLGHAWSGGDSRGSYADPKGPEATVEMLRFFTELS